MKKLRVGLISFLLLTGVSWGQDAMYFYNLGLDSSIACRKIYYFTKALELNPKLADAYEKRGMLYYFQEKYSKMIRDFQAVIELTPFESKAYLMLGLAYMKGEDYDVAIDNLTRAIELEPQLARAYSYRAEAYRLKGMIDEAIQDSNKAIEIGGTKQIIGMTYSTRSKAYRELGQIKLADADLKKALNLDPEYDIYKFFSITDYLANSSGESGSIKAVGRMGAALIIAIFFVLVFKLTLSAPKKDEDD